VWEPRHLRTLLPASGPPKTSGADHVSHHSCPTSRGCTADRSQATKAHTLRPCPHSCLPTPHEVEPERSPSLSRQRSPRVSCRYVSVLAAPSPCSEGRARSVVRGSGAEPENLVNGRWPATHYISDGNASPS